LLDSLLQETRMVTGEIQAVVLAAGKGSRMLDVTGGGVKCMLPLGGFPLLYFPLKMLERSGFQNVLVTVPESVRSDVCKLVERLKLNLKVDVVGVPGHEEWGTIDTLRHVSDKLTGSDILLVSGDVVTNQHLRILTDLHRCKKSGLTLLLNKPAFDLKDLTVPGSKSNKYKKERDLIGLSGSHVCLLKAEADVEDEINIPARVLKQAQRFTVHTNLQDAHVYVISRWILNEVLADKSMTAVKGEMIGKLVAAQFKAVQTTKHEKMDTDALLHPSSGANGRRQFGCYAAVSDELTVRVNNIPSYWEATRLLNEGSIQAHSDLPNIHPQADVHQKSQMKECRVGAGTVVCEKTSLTGVSLGSNCTVNEKVKLNNCIIMDNVRIASGVSIKDSIVCEGSRVEPGSDLSQCIVGKLYTVPENTTVANQILLDADRMMQV